MLFFKHFFITYLFMEISASRVLELSDRFSSIRQEGGYWLVKFYAPWCGYCKRLEPVWAHVAQALYRSNIRVGRVDCSRFPNIAAEFKINGFPTIKFITPDQDHTFHGDQNKEDILNFAFRMAGPPVQEITSSESLSRIKGVNQLFFMYVGRQDDNLWTSYLDVASKMQPHGFFYFAKEEIAKQHVDMDEVPAVFVYKDGLHTFYSEDVDYDAEQNHEQNSSMYKWINEERFDTFPKITKGNINEIIKTNKYIVIAVVEENKLQQIPPEMLEFRETVESLIRRKKDKYHKYFQFGWVGSPDIANSIAMQVLPLPSLVVLNSTTGHFHIPEDKPLQMPVDVIDLFLDRVFNQTAPVYGGNGLTIRYYRTYFEITTALANMWRGNPTLTSVLVGLPFSFLCFILYSICCTDILDAEDEEEDPHEKRD
ncbi:hypothetical protein NQ318_008178 [Aromia moschata]|uniref:Thioredoxin domain-containing protein n=1 Tax=Aromia moschata TaxID=1265417 RepID=A0AAV8YL09_9CUCU|nr:hypothetical protein NQ318_008178 [Aromia moschata]